jgi:Mg2+-importing ATPase
VPGDVVLLSAGSLIQQMEFCSKPRFFLSSIGINGRTFPVEKIPGTMPVESTLQERTNYIFMGTNGVPEVQKCLSHKLAGRQALANSQTSDVASS